MSPLINNEKYIGIVLDLTRTNRGGFYLNPSLSHWNCRHTVNYLNFDDSMSLVYFEGKRHRHTKLVRSDRNVEP